jgi:anthranilate phosphoribosyltransferase
VIQEAIRALVDGGGLTGPQAAGALETILAGEATPAQIGAFLTALRLRGESPEVIAACLDVTERHAEAVPAEDVIDVVGTGADGADTFNVSTAAAIVAAACGVRVAKHGNRAASSRCGSADVLEALGAELNISGGAAAARIIDECGFCFLFAQRFHPAFRHVGPVRREIGVRTIFNFLGPLSNPARPGAMLVGSSLAALGPTLAETFRLRGMRRAIVVHSLDGLDEISPSGPTRAWFVDDGQVREREIGPADFGLPAHPLELVLGGDAPANAKTMLALLDGQDGPVMDFVLMNAAAALYVAGRTETLAAGVPLAREALSSGRARRVLDAFVALSKEAAGG